MRPISLLLLLMLAGCSSLAPAPKTLPASERELHWQQQQLQMESLQQWQLAGKLGIRTESSSASVHLNWDQGSDHYRIRIASAIGQTLALLQGSPGGVALSTADDSTLYSISAEQLLREELGWELPVSDLHYWIRGIPAPGSSTPRLNNQGLLESLQQGRWSLRFNRYQQVGRWQLPGRLIAEGPEARLTFIINDWKPLN
ncbi:lipoprotein insertase outer membrane protein LolB [Aestuariirhabdus sp. LZHN29]|uniref:lipoprotein insertase outer membrane protein LolB n=1 Tax=Aestuariirhabdus sp. LZHN29 TaxID=3417462 RepID=UPI003CEDABE9